MDHFVFRKVPPQALGPQPIAPSSRTNHESLDPMRNWENWGVPEIGLLPNHPSSIGIFPEINHAHFLGSAMAMETTANRGTLEHWAIFHPDIFLSVVMF